VVARKRGDDSAIHRLPGKVAPITTALRMKFDLLLLHAYTKTDGAFGTLGWLPYRLDRLMCRFAPDIVHLHNPLLC
jgi:hypothetical protein